MHQQSLSRTGIEEINHWRGHQLRAEADALSRQRITWAPAVGTAIALSPDSSWIDTGLALAVGYLHRTDMLDGQKGRASAKLLGIEPPAESKALDHLADKRLFYWVVGGLSVRAARRSKLEEAALFAGLGIGCAIRDRHNIQMRDQATAEGINTGSRQMGRLKTMLFAGVSTAFVSPLGRSEGKFGKVLRIATSAVGGLSIASHLDMKHHIDQARKVNNQRLLIAAGPESASDQAERSHEEFRLWPPTE